MTDPAPAEIHPASLWRPSPARFARLMLGLTLFGAGEACLVAAGLGNSPWTVFAQGVSVQTPLSIGAATVLISFVVLLLWFPLHQLPGLGTVCNAIWVGVAFGGALLVLPEDPGTGYSWVLMLGGVAVVALGSGFYLPAALGPGPRDGLMTGLHRRTGLSLRLVRAAIELTVLVAGFLLGGTVGIGTLVFAVGIGPGVQLAVERLSTPEWRALDPAPAPRARLSSPVARGEASE